MADGFTQEFSSKIRLIFISLKTNKIHLTKEINNRIPPGFHPDYAVISFWVLFLSLF